MKTTLMPFLLTAITLASCTTLQDATSARGTGEQRVYNNSYDVVWDTAVSVVDESPLDLVSASKDEGQILGQRGMTAFSYGENVAVFVDEITEDSTSVEVVSRRALQTNITARDWSAYILDAISEILE